MLVLTTMDLAALPLMLLVAAASDVIRSGSWRSTRFVLATAWSLCVHVVGLGLFAWSWLFGGAWLGADRERQRTLDLAVQCWLASWTWNGVARLYRMRLRVEGDEVLASGPILLLSRHASLLDTILPMVILASRHGLRLRYVMKKELLWDPCVDLIGHRFPTAFVARGTQQHAPELAKVRGLLAGLTEHDAVVLFPEGTRYSDEKRARVLRSLERKQPEVASWAAGLHHVLPPHPGGALTLLSREDVDVVFCAHTGLEGTSHLADLIGGSLLDKTVEARFWRVPASAIPEGDEARLSWLRQWWERVDGWIEERRQTHN